MIVGIVDADGELDAACLRVIAGRGGFGDERVGAVQVAVRISNRSRLEPLNRRPMRQLLLDLQDMEFVGPIAAMQLLRRRTQSVSMGGNGQFTRLSALDAVAETAGSPWHGALLEDFVLGLHILLAGFETRYCHDTYVAQEGLSSLRLLVRQRSRWAQGSMQCSKYLGAVLRSRRLTNLAAFEVSYFLLLPWIQLIGSLVYVAAYIVLVCYLLAAPGDVMTLWKTGQWGVIPLVLLGGVGPFLMWGPIYRRHVDPSISLPRALVLGFANWLYSTIHSIAIWWAFIRTIRTTHDWKKTERLGISSVSSEASLSLPTAKT